MERMQSSVHPMKRILCLALAFVLLLGMVPVTARAAEGTTLYLKPNDSWLEANARFAVYSWDGSGSAWADMTGPDENGIYEGTVPAGHTDIIFCRMNPDAAANDWNNKWNQTADLTVPTDGSNLYTLNAGDWNGGGVWSIYSEEPEEPSSGVEESSSEAGGDEEALYIVAGDAALCGSEWNAADTANRMYLMEDGTYTITYADVAPGTYSLKVTDGTWNNNWGDNGGNYVITVSAVCDVTITFDPSSDTISVTGDSVAKVTTLEISSIHAVGNGSGNWLNGASWNTAANAMTETSDNVYEITFEDVPAGTGYQFKFAANGSWTNSWGGGAEGEAVYNGQNISLSIEYALADVTLKLDLSGYDHGSKSGATYTVTVTEAVAEPTVDYYLVGYINGADYGCEGDYENLGEYKFENGKLTAKFDVDSYVFIKTGDNSGWYMFETYVSTTSGTLYPSSDTICEKMLVPGGVEVEFTLTENADGTLTLSYTTQTTEPEEPVVDYYLIGSINGANYGCEEDYENLGEYNFVDGKLTAKFDSDSYVFVKTGDNLGWFMTNGWLGTEVTSATLYNTSNNASFPDGTNKLYVPGGVEYVFTLAENEDGSLTLSYAEKPDTTDVTVHFFKPEGWGNTINAYLWISGAVPGYEDYNAWPGKAVSANSQHPGWYDLVVSLETPMAFNFIFNDGGNQTADLYTGDVTGDTELWVVGDNVMSTAPGEWSGDYDYTANLYFQKPEGWADTVNAYLWTDAETISAPWPGDTAESDAINGGWYSYTVTMDENAGFNFIFNDGTNQTGNLTTGTLDVKTDLWIVDGIVLTEAPAGWRNPNRTIHVPGTFPGPSWDAASNQMTWDAELGLYVYTFENVPAANYEYKIAVNGSWNENYGAGGVRDGANMAVAVTETTDVTVYYNDETHNSVTSVSYVFADATLSGTGIPEGTKLTDKGLTGIYSVTVPMTAGTYTDLVITCNGTEYAFAEVEVKEDKDVTFFLDPITGIFYCNASPVPVNAEAIYFDSQDETYKQPFGAVATGEDVTFSIDTGADIINAVLVVKGVGSWPMTAEETETGKRWSATTSFSAIGEYDYYFSLSNGSTVAIYSDDDGYYGEGMVTELTDAKPYDLVVYKAGFKTPDWMKDAVIYQIFPDRFFDGDVSNNQAQTWARGDVNYEYITDWYTLPENPEQKAMLDEATYKSTGAHYGDGEWSNEIYGGDLEGITERIGYLKALGVNVIYLNPIFWSISNHRYDAVDYMEIDPVLGTLGDFEELVKIAEKNDMHIILDGVFNHVSDDSVYFDRYYKFLGTSNKIGAYPYWAYVYDYMAANSVDMAAAEAAAKAYFSTEYGITDWSYTTWFAVSGKTMAGTVDDIGLRAGKEVYSYEGWWGYDSMPVIKSTNGSEYQTGNWAQEIICNAGETSVTQYWITKGNNGWRLDVANEVSDETWQRFRDSVKALDSDAVIIGEIWDDATKYLKGDMYDSVMNYLFRNAATSFAMGSDAAETMMQLEKIRERYPEEAFYAMMNLVGSHDTTRLLSYLDGIADDRSQKDLASAFPTYEATSPEAKQMQHLVAFLQFTYAGAPTIYYGDEIGMVGSDDPDDRRAMEWGQGSKELVEWYAKLAAIRAAYPALRTGTVEPLELENTYDLLAFVRRDEANTVTVIANNAFDTVDVQLEGTYIDLVTGKTFNGTVPACGGVILVAEDEVKIISVNYAGLAPAYDPAYTVAERPEGVHIHKYEAVVTDPTCTEEGFTTYTCDLCGDSYTGDPIPTVPHAETAAITAPTCTGEGFTTYTCDLCGASRTDDFVDALGHSYSYTDSENIRTYTCDTCGDSYESKVILLASGKSKTLKFIHPVTGKTVSGSKVNWKIEDIFAVNPYEYEEDMGEYKAPIDPKYFSAYATIKNGKLKTNKNGDRISILITASLKSDPAITNSYCIELTPATTMLSAHAVHITNDDAPTGYMGASVFYCNNLLDLNGRTTADGDYLAYTAASYPGNANLKVNWKSSDSKVAKVVTEEIPCIVNEYYDEALEDWVQETETITVVKVYPVWSAKTGKFKAGTATITGTAADGSGKEVSFKVEMTSLPHSVEIVMKDGKPVPGDTVLWEDHADPTYGMTVKPGKTYTFKANVDPNTSSNKKAVKWMLLEEEKSGLKISDGKITIPRNACNGDVICIGVETKYSPNVSDTIYLKVASTKTASDILLTEYDEEYDGGNFQYLFGSTSVIDVSKVTAKENLPFGVYGAQVTPKTQENQVVTWSLDKDSRKIASIVDDELVYWYSDVTHEYVYGTVDQVPAADSEGNPVMYYPACILQPKWVDTESGGYCKTGTVTLTATAADGTEKSAKIKIEKRINEMRIETKDGREITYDVREDMDTGYLEYHGHMTATAGEKIQLKVGTNSNAKNKAVTWEFGHEVRYKKVEYASISSNGLLTISKNIPSDGIELNIVAVAKDGRYISARLDVSVAPRATNVHVRMDDGDGMKYVSNSTRTWDVSDSKTLSLSALVYPFNARQDVKWSVSNSKIASVDQNGLLTFTGKKFGKLTVTATARDGSKVKSSVTLNVIRTVQNMELPAAMVTTAGKTVKLASKLTFDPKPTVKSIRWSMQMAKFAEDGSRTLVDVPSSVATLNAKTGDLKVSKKLSGYAYLYVTAYDSKSGVSAETEVYLCPKAMTGIVVKNLNGKTIKSGSTVTVTGATDFRFTVAPKNSTAKTYHDWIGLLAFSAKTSDEDIAVIETNAEMTEVSVVQTSEAGKVKVTIKAKDGSGKSFSFYVNFKNAPVTAE